jgi:hypothetical protein
MSKVTCICYGQEQTFRSRKAAIDFYAEAMFNTEGAESYRYKTILGKLYRGEDVCSDEEISWAGLAAASEEFYRQVEERGVKFRDEEHEQEALFDFIEQVKMYGYGRAEVRVA